ncbi:MAG: GNAT family N-acetyltransferase [Fimbriimonadaceae bacterium]|nr:GNAT family N-acetyltransferase [Fimbriimonadaceae bacterium]QYK55212.1 MAG: GNAT family N-acetyltransferase [Fimbriimonadaceae bacterium]
MDDWERPQTLEGRWVRLEPLEARHAPGLLDAFDLETFRYFTVPRPEMTVAGFERLVQDRTAPGSFGYAVVLREGGKVVGSSSMFDLNPAHRNLEIGHTWYAPQWRGTFVNPESKLLMLRHAFEAMGCIRVQLKCDDRNERSKAGIRKLGAKFEGVLRNNVVMPDGHRRQTAYFSVLPEEWPDVKAALLNRLEHLGGQG